MAAEQQKPPVALTPLAESSRTNFRVLTATGLSAGFGAAGGVSNARPPKVEPGIGLGPTRFGPNVMCCAVVPTAVRNPPLRNANEPVPVKRKREPGCGT